MSSQTSKGLASRMGYGLGRAVRFMLADSNVALRWIKRTVFASVLIFIALWFGRDLVSASISLLVLGIGLIALTRTSTPDAVDDQDGLDAFHHPSIPFDGPDGYGYYDGYGNFRGSSNPYDDD